MSDPHHTAGQAVDVRYTLQPSEARAILHGFWGKRLLRSSPAAIALILAYVYAVGRPYWASALTGLGLFSFTWVAVMALWDVKKLPALCRQVHVRWSSAGVQVANPQETKQFHWTSVTGCELSQRFLTTNFTDGQAIHLTKRSFSSQSDLQKVLTLATEARVIDVQKPAQ